MKPVHYADYLQLDKILGAQQPESELHQMPAHDEMLFIIIHQAYELWFKQIMYEVESVNRIFKQPALNDNSPELQTIVHRLQRSVTILKLLVQQIDVMETMTPMDFLDFRDMLRPASGFQSWQFKALEARLGLQFGQRHGQEYYISQLRPEQVALIKQVESEQPLISLVNQWLERMPFLEEASSWFEEYATVYQSSLTEKEKANWDAFQAMFSERAPGNAGEPVRQLSGRASRAALFIMLYRGYPLLQLPFQLLNVLLEIDEQLSTWRYRHMNMVHRMIGTRVGTGGSTGKEYLKGAVDKHYIFREIAQLTSFLVERRRLPVLDPATERRLGFSVPPKDKIQA
ncbi:tryptophan 2,3-dioxygenase family protein [Flavihumibacter sp. CACIAM 22H1]|uniref:tryptophan 2,3-dioxygenase family protein n=1 Tax=Flavihumibacter sp. CACIAM 22H1 TaxID=1812911 RepID=UPI0007A92F94|nr:tryptophan 2,3-dioxygenase family protein [Flavihumibacter sp. CACIAM 22H1]KYP15270.1 MAG: tryptophan 2,3-dioxygenase [Flavihumibacter sp. CACIAM 22H1]